MNDELRKSLRKAAENEITEHFVYKRLSLIAEERGDKKNSKVLKQIAEDELRHYRFYTKLLGEEVKPKKRKIIKYFFLARTLGLTFALRLMESGEDLAQEKYEELLKKGVKGVKKIIDDEREHEDKLISMIKEEKLNYVGSIVLGLNDALVELTGALAGFTLALANNSVIGIAGLVTGIAAALSMASSGYLEAKAENEAGEQKRADDEPKKHPLKAALYTGVAYLITVLLLVAPFFIIETPIISLGITITTAIIIIAFFNYYIAVAKKKRFLPIFLEMVFISLTVAAISFGIAFLLRKTMGID